MPGLMIRVLDPAGPVRLHEAFTLVRYAFASVSFSDGYGVPLKSHLIVSRQIWQVSGRTSTEAFSPALQMHSPVIVGEEMLSSSRLHRDLDSELYE